LTCLANVLPIDLFCFHTLLPWMMVVDVVDVVVVWGGVWGVWVVWGVVVVYQQVVLLVDCIERVGNAATATVDLRRGCVVVGVGVGVVIGAVVVVFPAIVVQTELLVFVMFERPFEAFSFHGCVVPVGPAIAVQGARCVRASLGWPCREDLPNQGRLRRRRRRRPWRRLSVKE